MQFNFRKQTDIDSQGSPYDYRSVMHYGKKAFGGDKITLDPIDKVRTKHTHLFMLNEESLCRKSEKIGNVKYEE